jgi:hypothetical protein
MWLLRASKPRTEPGLGLGAAVQGGWVARHSAKSMVHVLICILYVKGIDLSSGHEAQRVQEPARGGFPVSIWNS